MIIMDSKRTSEKLAKQLEAVRQKKILKLKSKISGGKYKVRASDLAFALFMAK